MAENLHRNTNNSSYKRAGVANSNGTVSHSNTFGGYKKIPRDVMRRKDLTTTDKLVFIAMLFEIYDENLISASCQHIADECGCSKAAVSRSFQKLERKALIQKVSAVTKQVQPYAILHPIVAGKPAKTDSPVPEPQRAFSLCSECGCRLRNLPKSGRCRDCVDAQKIADAKRMAEDGIQPEQIVIRAFMPSRYNRALKALQKEKERIA